MTAISHLLCARLGDDLAVNLGNAHLAHRQEYMSASPAHLCSDLDHNDGTKFRSDATAWRCVNQPQVLTYQTLF
jgi:hypothetical protein